MTTEFPCQNHLTHNYAFPELTLGGGSNQQAYFRVMIFFNKKPHHTDEFFHDHWKSVHADLCMSVPGAGVNFVRYVQFHQDAKHKAMISSLVDSGAMKLMPFDGAAEFHCKSADDFVAFMTTLHNSPQTVGCGKRFVDLDEGYHIMVGYDNLIFGDGISTSGGLSGVMPGDERLKKVADEDTTSSKVLKTPTDGRDVCKCSKKEMYATPPPETDVSMS